MKFDRELSEDEILKMPHKDRADYWEWLAGHKLGDSVHKFGVLRDKELIKNAIMASVGDLSEIEVMGNRVMVAVYIRKKIGSLYMPGQSQKEDEYQGKVCLVLKKGKLAFQSDLSVDFHGQDVEVGDWVLVSANNRKNFLFRDVLCAHVEDIRIEQKITHPDEYY